MRAESTRKVAGPVIHLTVRFDNPSAGRLWSGWRHIRICGDRRRDGPAAVGFAVRRVPFHPKPALATDTPHSLRRGSQRHAFGAFGADGVWGARLPGDHGPPVRLGGDDVHDIRPPNDHRSVTSHEDDFFRPDAQHGVPRTAPQLSLDPPLTLLLSLWRHPAVAVNLNFAGRPNRHGRRNPTGALHSERM